MAAAALLFAPAALADSGQSTNWAGYAVHGTSFRQISATWQQPSVACLRGRDTYSAYWVGLGGYNLGSQALEQIGTEADCNVDGSRTLSAWYEMVPAASMPIAMTIAPGDRMQADVAVSGHRATLVLRDRTRHRAFRISVSAAHVDVSSAEWIVEAPSDCMSSCVTLPLADFGAAVFSAARAQTTGGHWGAINDPAWSATRITLAPQALLASGHASRSGAVPSSLEAGGTSFAVSFGQAAAGARVFSTRRGHRRAAGHTRARRLTARGLVHPVRQEFR